ncbi:hypothetical protein MSP7336_03706 [Mycobacterium shimoidei]|uniref:Uncharacterized protein n=1 Tax=Mycobacterium shimoidei TaxID=29313 RepID=A0A375Z2Y6_MYCSH|nr:hypothetical protein MSP7336_03706 [Mycobacterium shimoidei]
MAPALNGKKADTKLARCGRWHGLLSPILIMISFSVLRRAVVGWAKEMRVVEGPVLPGP